MGCSVAATLSAGDGPGFATLTVRRALSCRTATHATWGRPGFATSEVRIVRIALSGGTTGKTTICRSRKTFALKLIIADFDRYTATSPTTGDRVDRTTTEPLDASVGRTAIGGAGNIVPGAAVSLGCAMILGTTGITTATALGRTAASIDARTTNRFPSSAADIGFQIALIIRATTVRSAAGFAGGGTAFVGIGGAEFEQAGAHAIATTAHGSFDAKHTDA